MRDFDQDDAARAAQARDAIPTLAEVMAADHWVTMPGGGIVPVRLARVEGWGQDEDRDSAMAQALSQHVKRMDELAREYFTTDATDAHIARHMAKTWEAIRKITRSNGGR